MGDAGRRGAVFFALALVAMLLAGCGGGDDGAGSNPSHVNEKTGEVHGVPLDERVGTPPPPVKKTDLLKAAEEADCYVFPKFKGNSHKHLPPGTPTPEFSGPSLASTVPPYGDHVEPPHQQADGAYLVKPETADYLGSLDHGRITIQYAPDLEEKAQLQLKGLYDTMYGGTLMFPNQVMPYAVAATAWQAVLGCTTYGQGNVIDVIRAFGKAYWGKRGNDPLEAAKISGPTPRDPAD